MHCQKFSELLPAQNPLWQVSDAHSELRKQTSPVVPTHYQDCTFMMVMNILIYSIFEIVLICAQFLRSICVPLEWQW